MKSKALFFFIFVLASFLYTNVFANSNTTSNTPKGIIQKLQLYQNNINNQSLLIDNCIIELADDEINETEKDKSELIKTAVKSNFVLHQIFFTNQLKHKLLHKFFMPQYLPLFIFIKVFRL